MSLATYYQFTGPGLDGYEPSKMDFSQSDKVGFACVNCPFPPSRRAHVCRTASFVSQWRKILARRCAEIVGEMGEMELFGRHQDGWRLAVAACNVDVESR